MQMWGGGAPPLTFDPAASRRSSKEIGPPPPDPPPYGCRSRSRPSSPASRSACSATAQVIGKAIAENGIANIPATFADGSGPSGQLQVVLDPDEGPPVTVPVRESQTTLTRNCPAEDEFHSNNLVTITGKLAGAPAGSVVDVTWTTRNDDEVVERTVVTHPTTDAEGNWSTSLQSQSFEDGTWSVASSYAGTEGYAPSQGPECSFHVQDNS